MSPLNKIKAAGFEISLSGDTFTVSPSSKLTQQQREFLKQYKDNIITELNVVTVICYTPRGSAYEVEATSAEHATWLSKMNPKHTQAVE